MVKGKVGNRKFMLEAKFGRTGIEKCPVCGKSGTRSKLSRHIMNSRGEPRHEEFMAEQDKILLANFDATDAMNFSVEALSFFPGIYCSESHVRALLTTFRSQWKEKAKIHRSTDTSRQYGDGRRKRQTTFGKGWKASKDLGTGNYMSKEKRESILAAFASDKQINEIAKEIGCKNETVSKIWKEEFSDEEYNSRLDRTWRFIKPSKEDENAILKLFKSKESCKEIARRFETHVYHVKRIWEEKFGEEAYAKRAKEMRALGILKSLEAMGRMTASGQGSRPEYECFLELSSRIVGVRHHDMDIAPPYEVDISVRDRKLAILWDGPLHRYPIFGTDRLKLVKRRDAGKIALLRNAGWTVVVIEDDCKKFKYMDMRKVVSMVLAAKSSLYKVIVGVHGDINEAFAKDD